MTIILGGGMLSTYNIIKAILPDMHRPHVFVGLRMQADSAAGEEIFENLSFKKSAEFV